MRVTAWVDGGARGNPGPAGYGVLLTKADGQELARIWGYLGETTNNVAEYKALLAALDESLRLGATVLEVRTDSELIDRQVRGVYKVRQPHLRSLLSEVKLRIAKLSSFVILHVRRERNRVADELANRAMDEKSDGREAPVAS